MAVYSFPRMDGQPSRMTTEQLCEDAYDRGFLEGKAAGSKERETALRDELEQQLLEAQSSLKDELTLELDKTYHERYQQEFEHLVDQIKDNEKQRDTDLTNTVISVITKVCSEVLDQALSTESSQSIASIERLLSTLPITEDITEIQMGESVYAVWSSVQIKQVRDIAICLNSSLAPLQIRLVSHSQFHEIDYQERLDGLINQLIAALRRDEE